MSSLPVFCSLFVLLAFGYCIGRSVGDPTFLGDWCDLAAICMLIVGVPLVIGFSLLR